MLQMWLVTAWGLNEWTAADRGEERERMSKGKEGKGGGGCIFCPPPYIMRTIRMTGEICFVTLWLWKINASIPVLCTEAVSQIAVAKTPGYQGWGTRTAEVVTHVVGHLVVIEELDKWFTVYFTLIERQVIHKNWNNQLLLYSDDLTTRVRRSLGLKQAIIMSVGPPADIHGLQMMNPLGDPLTFPVAEQRCDLSCEI